MFSLPNSELYIWLRWTDKGKKIAKEIISLLGSDPYEQTINQGIGDLRWETADFDSAVRLAETLRIYIDDPEVILIKANGKVAGVLEVFTVKDSRNIL
jgi:hypothetical protein